MPITINDCMMCGSHASVEKEEIGWGVLCDDWTCDSPAPWAPTEEQAVAAWNEDNPQPEV